MEEQLSPQQPSLPPVEPVGLNKRNCGSKVRKRRLVRRRGEKVGAALPLPPLPLPPLPPPPPPLPLPLRRLLLAAMSAAGLSCDPHASLGGGNGDGAPGSTPLSRLLRLRETGAFAGTAPSSDDVIPMVTGSSWPKRDLDAMSHWGSFAAAPARAPPQPGRPASLRTSFCDHARGWRRHQGAFPGAACSLMHSAAFAGTHGGWSQRSFAYGLEHNPATDLRWAPASVDVPVFAMSMLDSGLLKVFALPPGEPHTCATLCGGGRGSVTDFCFALGGTRLVSAFNTDSVLRVHALADGCWKLDESSAAWAARGATATPRLAVHPREERDHLVASLHSDSSLLLWDVSSLGRPEDVCPKKAQRLRRASELCWLGDTALAVGSESQSQLAVYDTQQCAQLWRADRAHPGTLAVLCAGPGGSPDTLCSGGGEDGTVALWDTRLSGSAQPRCRMALAPYAAGEAPEVTALALSSCATLLAAGSTDNRVRVFDLRGGTGASALHVLSHGAPARVHRGRGSTTAMSVGAVDPGDQGVNGLAWFHSSPCLATAGGTGTGLWDVRMGAPCVLWRPVGCAASPHLRGVNCVAVHGSDAAMVTGGDDMRVALWAPEGQAAWLGGLSLERR